MFEFENKQSEGVCDVKLHFGHISGFSLKQVPLEVEITAPDGKTEMLPSYIKLIDDSGKDLGAIVLVIFVMFFKP